MAISPKYLNEGERVVVSTRTHAKVLIGPVIVLLVTVFLAAYLTTVANGQLDGAADQAALLAVWVVAVAVLFWWVLRPFVRWYTTTYTFTNRRFMQRSGFVSQEGRTIPLNRISGVDFEIGVLDRLFGCGTLVVSDASEQGRVPIKDIPQVERVQMQIAEELHRLTSGDRPHDDGT